MSTLTRSDDVPLDHAQQVLASGEQLDVDYWFALVSGGYDSDTALDITVRHAPFRLEGVVCIDTGIAVRATHEFIRRRAQQYRLPVYQPRNRREGERYIDLIRRFGPVGPPLHTKVMYANLKEKPLRRWASTLPGSVGFISGVRQDESDRRLTTVDADGINDDPPVGTVWLAPLAQWQGIDITHYRSAHDLPDSPVVERLGMSGDCLCGAYAHRDELELLRTHFPRTYLQLVVCELVAVVQAIGGEIDHRYAFWGHGGMDDRTIDALTDTEQASLCQHCAHRVECVTNQEDRPYEPVTTDEADVELERIADTATTAVEAVWRDPELPFPPDDGTVADEWDEAAMQRFKALLNVYRDAIG